MHLVSFSNNFAILCLHVLHTTFSYKISCRTAIAIIQCPPVDLFVSLSSLVDFFFTLRLLGVMKLLSLFFYLLCFYLIIARRDHAYIVMKTTIIKNYTKIFNILQFCLLSFLSSFFLPVSCVLCLLEDTDDSRRCPMKNRVCLSFLPSVGLGISSNCIVSFF